ncbi:Uncharacterised protein [Rodentibacter pneumotropicus]|uniref:Uncharacterized protein n=1 Tax=Rodentibacter pneumotropicus TaxID=758 RepID=A0A3S4VBS6_9PAST|nr:Uncharacterised protein [Rodentibacter pneumotropicus]
MSENEGNMDAVHSYDSEILTAGAMQKQLILLAQGNYRFKCLSLNNNTHHYLINILSVVDGM